MGGTSYAQKIPTVTHSCCVKLRGESWLQNPSTLSGSWPLDLRCVPMAAGLNSTVLLFQAPILPVNSFIFGQSRIKEHQGLCGPWYSLRSSESSIKSIGIVPLLDPKHTWCGSSYLKHHQTKAANVALWSQLIVSLHIGMQRHTSTRYLCITTLLPMGWRTPAP